MTGPNRPGAHLSSDAEVEERWQRWVLERNRNGTRTLLWIAGVLYPLFGITDYLLAPAESLWILLGMRAILTVLTFTLLPMVRTPHFDRNQYLFSAAYLAIGGFGISVMTALLGGMASVYSQGLHLVLVAAGLLFVWPIRVVLVAYASVVASFVVLNLAVNGLPTDLFHGIANLFFLLSIAVLSTAAQILAYRFHRAQVEAQVVVERTRAHLEEANERLKVMDVQKSMFFQNMTHELRTPLTVINSALQNRLHDESAGDLRYFERTELQRMYRNGLRLDQLVGDLLSLARSEAGAMEMEARERDLVPHLRALLSDIAPLASRKEIELSFHAAVPNAIVWCDVRRLDRVFVNLIANALKFTGDKGKVACVIWREGDRIMVRVADTGPGFPPHLATRIFDRFYQVDGGSNRAHGGTGIGLALAREIVLQHGGTIEAVGVPGVGATFTVALRLGNSHLPAESLRSEADERPIGLTGGALQVADPLGYRLLDIQAATEKRRIERDPDEARHTHAILVVEDSDDVLHSIQATLQGDYKILAAFNGEEGLERALKYAPNLIISDYMMPGVDGIELLRRLRADERTRLTPVLMLTARGDVESRIQGLDEGANAYIAKPFDAEVLKATVRRLLRDQANAAEALLTKNLDTLEVITSGLAHQINNPLNYVRTAITVVNRDTQEAIGLMRSVSDPVSVARIDALSTRLGRMFDTIEVGMRRITDTVELMRRYSRDGYRRVPVSFPLFDGVRDVLRLVTPTAQAEIQVEVNLAGTGNVDCVPDEINQVLTNLVQNAVDALNSKGGGKLTVTGTHAEGMVVLSIRDNGPGIPPENRSRLFTPFFTTKGPGSGMGMGLFICNRIVTALGGTIRVESTVGRGTEMIVRLPASQRALPGVAAPPPRLTEEQRP